MAVPTNARHGAKSSIGGTAVALKATSTTFKSSITLKGGSGNSTNKVFVGNSNGVTAGSADDTDGYELMTDKELTLPAAFFDFDLANVWLIGSTSSLKVYWWAF